MNVTIAAFKDPVDHTASTAGGGKRLMRAGTGITMVASAEGISVTSTRYGTILVPLANVAWFKPDPAEPKTARKPKATPEG